jgi:hypothetical protein
MDIESVTVLAVLRSLKVYIDLASIHVGHIFYEIGSSQSCSSLKDCTIDS